VQDQEYLRDARSAPTDAAFSIKPPQEKTTTSIALLALLFSVELLNRQGAQVAPGDRSQ
jgi:hypothetical protein